MNDFGMLVFGDGKLLGWFAGGAGGHWVEELFEPKLERLSDGGYDVVGHVVAALEYVTRAPVYVVLGHVGHKVLYVGIATARETYVLHRMLE